MIKPMPFADYLNWLDEQRKALGLDRASPKPPGEILRDLVLVANHITQTELSKQLNCTHAKVNEIINGKRGITPKFALDLERVTEIKAEFWLSVQAAYELNSLRSSQN